MLTLSSELQGDLTIARDVFAAGPEILPRDGGCFWYSVGAAFVAGFSGVFTFLEIPLAVAGVMHTHIMLSFYVQSIHL